MHLVGILFPHINDDARSKSHQISRSIAHSTVSHCYRKLRVSRLKKDHTEYPKLSTWDILRQLTGYPVQVKQFPRYVLQGPEHVLIVRHRKTKTWQGLQLRCRRTSTQRHSKQNHDNCLEGVLIDLTAATLECCCGALLTFRQAICHKIPGLQRPGVIILRDDAKHQAAKLSFDWLRLL